MRTRRGRGRAGAAALVRGNAEPVDVFTTVPAATADAALDAWNAAYVALASGAPEARAMLMELRATWPEDPLVALHLERIDAGARDAVIDLRG